jgi:hypothetical protein
MTMMGRQRVEYWRVAKRDRRDRKTKKSATKKKRVKQRAIKTDGLF